MFFFDFSNYFKMLGLAWNETSQRARIYFLFVLVCWVPVVASVHALCFLLDRILFPGLAHIEVVEPVFLVGHARSGTTLTHRLMAGDEGRFSYFLLWECYFPSLLQKKIIRALGAVDRKFLGGTLGRFVPKFDQWRYGRGRHIHRMGLTIAEEDDISLYYSMASGFWMTRMPYLEEMDFFDMDGWPPARRRRYNDFYREVVKRQLYLNGSDKIHLAKNPAWAGRVESLIEAFPDARFVVNVRDPRETIPSLLKLLTSAWKALGWDADRQRKSLDAMVETSFESYVRPLRALDAHPGTKSAVVDYRELVTDPSAAIESLYKQLDLPLADDYRDFLSRQSRRESEHRSGFRYSLEEFGLEGDRIRRELSELFERFQWDSEGVPESD